MNEQNQTPGTKAGLYAFFFGALWVFIVWRGVGAISAPAPAPQAGPGAAITLYYADKQAMYVVPLSLEAQFPATAQPEIWAQALFNRLTQAPDKDVVSAISPGTRLLGAVWSKPLWTLHVQIPKGQGTTGETLMADGIVRSFIENFPGATQVQLSLVDAEGKPYASQHLDLSQPLSEADVANHAGDGSPEGVAVTCWWRLPGTYKLVPVETTLQAGSGDLARDVFHRLVMGPPEASRAFLGAVVPEGLSAEWEAPQGGIAQIDLNRDLPHTPSAQRFIEATTLTLTALPGLKAVRFLNDGLPFSGRVGPYDLSKAIARPQTQNTPPMLQTAAFGHQTP
jgi:spore germination protein GerM